MKKKNKTQNHPEIPLNFCLYTLSDQEVIEKNMYLKKKYPRKKS